METGLSLLGLEAQGNHLGRNRQGTGQGTGRASSHGVARGLTAGKQGSRESGAKPRGERSENLESFTIYHRVW